MTTSDEGGRPGPGLDFIRAAVAEDMKTNRWGGRVVTRFPPEPNGYLHIGHAKAMLISYSIAKENDGEFHFRFDDTNPTREEDVYVQSQKEDVRWLGCDWGEHLYFASDYFDRMYEWAVQLIRDGKAYVDDLSPEEIREYRGTLTTPGRNSPYRERPVEENLELFERMREGEFEEGSRVLRAKIDMASKNIVMRDPVMYRILNKPHHRTGDTWHIYPTYDWAHGLEDSIEGVTHSLCTVEFEIHRPLYDWFLDQLGIHHPQQIEFARLNLTYTVLSKRKLQELVTGGHVNGWDDPRMPTLSGMRRRGYTPEAIHAFIKASGVARADSINEIEQLEFFLREDLNKRAPRYMGVLDPLRVVIENYPEGQVDELEAVNNPENPDAGTRSVPFSRVIYLEREDFMENPPRKFFRLAPGREVRLRYAYFITCTDVIKDENGEIVELRCTYDPETRGGNAPDGRKVKATLHWVSAEHGRDAEARLYERLFTREKPDEVPEGEHWTDAINPDSLEVLSGCKVEPAAADLAAGTVLQFERKGYFCVDPDSEPGRPVFNRTVTLRDTWARIQKSGKT